MVNHTKQFENFDKRSGLWDREWVQTSDDLQTNLAHWAYLKHYKENEKMNVLLKLQHPELAHDSRYIEQDVVLIDKARNARVLYRDGDVLTLDEERSYHRISKLGNYYLASQADTLKQGGQTRFVGEKDYVLLDTSWQEFKNLRGYAATFDGYQDIAYIEYYTWKNWQELCAVYDENVELLHEDLPRNQSFEELWYVKLADTSDTRLEHNQPLLYDIDFKTNESGEQLIFVDTIKDESGEVLFEAWDTNYRLTHPLSIQSRYDVQSLGNRPEINAWVFILENQDSSEYIYINTSTTPHTQESYATPINMLGELVERRDTSSSSSVLTKDQQKLWTRVDYWRNIPHHVVIEKDWDKNKKYILSRATWEVIDSWFDDIVQTYTEKDQIVLIVRRITDRGLFDYHELYLPKS